MVARGSTEGATRARSARVKRAQAGQSFALTVDERSESVGEACGCCGAVSQLNWDSCGRTSVKIVTIEFPKQKHRC